MKKIIFISLMTVIFIFGISADDNGKLQVPKNAIVISQSCTMGLLYITLIDLDNNEIVILTYQFGNYIPGGILNKLLYVNRTGIISDLAKQKLVQAKDSPVKPQN